jgi:hypothetical protein
MSAGDGRAVTPGELQAVDALVSVAVGVVLELLPRVLKLERGGQVEAALRSSLGEWSQVVLAELSKRPVRVTGGDDVDMSITIY